MNLFKKSLIGIFVFVILGTIIPLFSVNAASVSGFKFHTGSTNNNSYPPTSNYLQYPTMYIETTVSFTGSDPMGTCIVVEATSDVEYRPYELLQFDYENQSLPTNSVCKNSNTAPYVAVTMGTPDDLLRRANFFSTEAAYADFYKQHTARIRYKINGGGWVYPSSAYKDWTTNNPITITSTPTPLVVNNNGDTSTVVVNASTTGNENVVGPMNCAKSNSNGDILTPWYNPDNPFSYTATASGKPETSHSYIVCWDDVGKKLGTAFVFFKPVVTVNASPLSIYSGESTVVSWSSDKSTDACSLRGNSSPSPRTYYPTTTETYTPICNRYTIFPNTTSGSAGVTVVVQPPQQLIPELFLKPSSPKDLVKKANTGEIGTSLLTIDIENIPTGKICTLDQISPIFDNIATYDNTDGSNPNWHSDSQPVSNISDLSKFQIECTDTAGTTSAEVDVKGQSGTLTIPVSCTISSGAGQCTNQSFNWTTVNPDLTTTTTIWRQQSSGGDVSVLTGNNGPQTLNVPGSAIPIGGTTGTLTYYSKNKVDGQTGNLVDNILDTKTIITNCASTTAWNGTVCAPVATVPTVTTAPVTQITQTSAKGSGTVVNNNGSAVTTSGIVWSTSPIDTSRNPNSIDPLLKTTSGWAIGGPWTPLHDMVPLNPNTFYYYRAYAINGAGFAYGNSVTFTTTATMFGSLTGSPNPCTIAANASTCNTSLSWTINNVESTSSNITANGMAPINLSTPTIGGDYGATIPNVVVPYPSRTFYLNNNGKSLVPSSPTGTGRVVNAQCASGTSWNGTICIAAPSGTLTASNCLIPLNGSSCPSSLNWTTTNPLAGHTSVITSNTPNPNTNIFTGNNGTNQSATVPYNSRSFFLIHNGVTLATATPSALCSLGTIWNETSGTCVTNISYTVTATAGANGTISPSTRTVSSGQTTTFTVTPNAGYTATIAGRCPRGSLVGTTYTTGPIVQNCDVSVTFVGSGGGTGNLTISPLTCDISQGASTCTVTGATWTTTNATQPSLVDVNTGAVLSTLANNATPLQVWVAYPQTVFNLRQNSIPGVLDTETVTAKCIAGTSWVEGKCVPVEPTGTITASDCTIPTGQNKCPTTIVWNTTNPTSGFTSEVTTPTDISVATGNGGNTTYTITRGDTIFYLYHNSRELGQDSARAECSATAIWNGTTCIANPSGNIPPVVNAGGDKSVVQPLDFSSVIGTATDSDGSIASTLWTKVSGPAGGTITSPNSLSTNITGLATAGTYVYRLTATDDDGASASDEMSITVSSTGSGLSIDLFTASPSRIFKGRTSTLRWETTGATSCTGSSDTIETFDTGGLSDSTTPVKPTLTTTYTLTCLDSASNSVEATAQVKVSVIKFFEI